MSKKKKKKKTKKIISLYILDLKGIFGKMLFN